MLYTIISDNQKNERVTWSSIKLFEFYVYKGVILLASLAFYGNTKEFLVLFNLMLYLEFCLY